MAAATALAGVILTPTHAQRGDTIIVPAPGVDADTRAITIDPSRATSDMGFGHALECAFPPSGAIEDCRPVVVAARIFR